VVVRPLVVLIALLVGCRSASLKRDELPEQPDSTAGTLDRPLKSAPVVTGRTVVAFWLGAIDTLAGSDSGSLLDDFRHYTTSVESYLRESDIRLVATTSDSVVVELEGGPRRVIMLAGLDFPFGYVLVEPGYPETILTGVTTDEDLLDEVDRYFGLEERDTGSDEVRVSDPQVPRRGGTGAGRTAAKRRWAGPDRAGPPLPPAMSGGPEPAADESERGKRENAQQRQAAMVSR